MEHLHDFCHFYKGKQLFDFLYASLGNKTFTKIGLLLDGCFGFLRRPFETVFQSISGRLPKRGRKRKERIDESKNVHTTPTRTYCKCSRPLPYCNPNCRTPRHWKFTQHHCTIRPPQGLLLTLLHPERPKLHAILAFPGAIGLKAGLCSSGNKSFPIGVEPYWKRWQSVPWNSTYLPKYSTKCTNKFTDLRCMDTDPREITLAYKYFGGGKLLFKERICSH